MAEEAQLEFEECAAILEHDGKMSREQAEAGAEAEIWG